ncbi:hypothetical protein ACLB2K_041134 [Fragaria x ananassa]
MRQMKLELATFGGGHPVEWLNRVEQYFALYQIPDDKKLAIASLHLTDRVADRWFMFKHEFPNSWQGLVDLLMREFSGYNMMDYQAALTRLNQTASVEQFKDQFTKLARSAPGIPQQVLLSSFIRGLKEGIRAEVRAQKPKTLFEACELAKIFEEKELSLRRITYNPRVSMAPVRNIQAAAAPQRVQPQFNQPRLQAAPQQGVARQEGGIIRLTQVEYQERRARN